MKQYLGPDPVPVQVAEYIFNVLDTNRDNQLEADEIVEGVPSLPLLSSTVHARDGIKRIAKWFLFCHFLNNIVLLPLPVPFLALASSIWASQFGPPPRRTPPSKIPFQRLFFCGKKTRNRNWEQSLRPRPREFNN